MCEISDENLCSNDIAMMPASSDDTCMYKPAVRQKHV